MKKSTIYHLHHSHSSFFISSLHIPDEPLLSRKAITYALYFIDYYTNIFS